MVLSEQTAALTEHERKIANHTAIQSWTAIISLGMSVITTAALIFIAFSQYRVSERQVALEYAKSAPQFYAQIQYRSATDDYGANTGVRLPVALELKVVHGDVTIKDISIVQEIAIRRDNDFRGLGALHPCTVSFNHWFALTPDRLQGTVSADVNTLFPSLEFMAADQRPAFMDAGPTRIRVKYDDIFGREHIDLVTVSEIGQVNVSKDIEGPDRHELGTAYFAAPEGSQPFQLHHLSQGCRGILIKA